MRRAILALTFFSLAHASTQALASSPWALSGKGEAYVLRAADVPRLVRICYPNPSIGNGIPYIVVTSQKNGSADVTAYIYRSTCADVGGTDILLSSPSAYGSAEGTYELLPR